MRSAVFSTLLFAALFSACNKGDTSPKAEPLKTEPVTPPVVMPTKAEPKSIPGVITSRTSLSKTPSKDSKVDEGGKKVSNWITVLQRGERVEVVKTEGDWSQVKASDGTPGWVSSSAILTSDELKEATVQAPTQGFDRPDLVAISKTKIDPGTLIFVIQQRDQFDEVNIRGGKSVWVLADKIDTNPAEVQLSKLIERARYLVEKEKGEGAPQLLEVAKTQFGSSKLLPILVSIVEPGGAAPAPSPEQVPKGDEPAKVEPSEKGQVAPSETLPQ